MQKKKRLDLSKSNLHVKGISFWTFHQCQHVLESVITLVAKDRSVCKCTNFLFSLKQIMCELL